LPRNNNRRINGYPTKAMLHHSAHLNPKEAEWIKRDAAKTILRRR
jgi:hypothetical protein